MAIRNWRSQVCDLKVPEVLERAQWKTVTDWLIYCCPLLVLLKTFFIMRVVCRIYSLHGKALKSIKGNRRSDH